MLFGMQEQKVKTWKHTVKYAEKGKLEGRIDVDLKIWVPRTEWK
jgi:hypothetical protein